MIVIGQLKTYCQLQVPCGMCCVVAQSVLNSLKTYNFQYSATTQHYSECTTEQLNLQEENPGTYTSLHMRTIHQLLSIT